MPNASLSSGWRGRVLINDKWLPVRSVQVTKSFAIFGSEPTYNALNTFYADASQVEHVQGQQLYSIEIEGEVWDTQTGPGEAFLSLLSAAIPGRAVGLSSPVVVFTTQAGYKFQGDIIIDSLSIQSKAGSNVSFNANIVAAKRVGSAQNNANLQSSDFAPKGATSQDPDAHKPSPIPYWRSLFITASNMEMNGSAIEWTLSISNHATPLFSHGTGSQTAAYIYPGYMEVGGTVRYYSETGEFKDELDIDTIIRITIGDISITMPNAIFTDEFMRNEGLNSVVTRTVNFKCFGNPSISVDGLGAPSGSPTNSKEVLIATVAG